MLIGIIGITAIPQFSSLISETTLNEATAEVVSAIQYAQSLAVLYQRPFSFKAYDKSTRNQFLVKDVRYAEDTEQHLDAAPPVYTYGRVFNPVDKKPYVIDFDAVQAPLEGIITPRGEFAGVDITDVPGGGTSGTIQFYPDGHSSSGSDTVILSYGGRQRTITVDGITGRVTVN
jgi:Tfp pilus assembly protein FimT